MFEHILQEFAQRIGIAEFAFSGQGVAGLDIQDVGTVFFERQKQGSDEELLVYMAKKYDTYDSMFPLKLLEFCSYEKAHVPPVYGSIAGDSCILGLRFSPEGLVSGTELENAVYYLNDKFQQLMQ